MSQIILQSKGTKDGYIEGFYYYGLIRGDKVYVISPYKKDICVINSDGMPSVLEVQESVSEYELSEIEKSFKIEWLLFEDTKFKLECKKRYEDVIGSKYGVILEEDKIYEIAVNEEKGLEVVGEDGKVYKLCYDIPTYYFGKSKEWVIG